MRLSDGPSRRTWFHSSRHGRPAARISSSIAIRLRSLGSPRAPSCRLARRAVPAALREGLKLHDILVAQVDGLSVVLDVFGIELEDVGDAHRDHPPIAHVAAAAAQPPLLQPIEEAGHVGHPAHHALPDLLAGQPVGTGTAQDPERVVLRNRQPMLLEQHAHVMGQEAGGPDQVEERLLLDRRERPGHLDLALESCHGGDSICYNDLRQHNLCQGRVNAPRGAGRIRPGTGRRRRPRHRHPRRS